MAAHAIVVPYPGQGHINPMMQFATKLASNGITVKFVLTQSWHKSMTQPQDNAFTNARTLSLPIRPGIIPDCVAESSQRWGKMTDFFLSLSNMEAHVSEIISNFNRSETPITCMVADTFLKWAPPFAKRQGLLFVSLWPTSLTIFSFFYRSVSAVPPAHLSNETAECVGNVREADLIVANSFYALECRVVEALREKMKTPLYCVGPLLPSAYFDRTDCRDRKLGHRFTDRNRLRSMAGFQSVSVGYLCFLRQFHSCVEASDLGIAFGLMKSGCYFVWSLRPDKEASHVSEMLPPGFLEASKDQGFVAPWFNQVETLNYFSVGGFLSHCGWNAVMESILSGVPILGFPLGIDQFPNCKLVVNELKFGLSLRSQDDENRVIAGEEIARKVKMLMEGEEGVKVRGAAEKFRELARGVVIDGGKSSTDFKAVADRLKETKGSH